MVKPNQYLKGEGRKVVKFQHSTLLIKTALVPFHVLFWYALQVHVMNKTLYYDGGECGLYVKEEHGDEVVSGVSP